MVVSPLSRLMALLIPLLLLLAACGVVPLSDAPSTLDPLAPQRATPAWRGIITMYAQAYTPEAHNARRPLRAFREIADEYERTHPGITIEFIDEQYEDYNDAVRVKANDGALWDVFWAQWAGLNNTLPPGIAVDLAPYFDQPNPYLPDLPVWRDAMNGDVVAITADPDGAHYNINGDFVATAFWYNQDIFDRAGIMEPPQTWSELIDAARQLEAEGTPAFVGVPYYPWWARHFLGDFYANDYNRIAGFDQLPGVSALDEAVAIKQGLYSADDPRFMGWWPIFKEFTDTWVADYIPQSPSNNAAAFQDFVAGDAAMVYSGSWVPNDLRDAGSPFPYGVFNFPPLGADVTPLSTGTNVSNATGGPSAGYQYAISTPQANASMTEIGKFDAVLDWLRYIGTPQVIERVVNEHGGFIPTWPGTQPTFEISILAEQAQLPLRTINSTNSSPQLEGELQRIFGRYLIGEIDLEAARPLVQRALDRALQDYQTRNNTTLGQFR
jgi:raffinose/stachyose/melibiose transport system substrate-binding protein